LAHIFSAIGYLKKSLHHFNCSWAQNPRCTDLFSSSFSTFKMLFYVHWLGLFLKKILSLFICLLSSVHMSFFLGLFLRFLSVSLVLSNLIMYLGVVCFMFLLLGVHLASWICGFIVSIKFGKLSAVISSNIFLLQLPLSRIPTTHIYWPYEVVSQPTDGSVYRF